MAGGETHFNRKSSHPAGMGNFQRPICGYIYVAKRNLVEDWADAEDQQLVFSQIPSGLQAKCLAETRKRRGDKKWVRVVIPAPLSTLEVLRDLEVEVGFPIRPISQEKRNVVIACTSDVEMQTLLGLDGAKFEGRVVKIQRAEYSMTGDELFAFVRRLLETDEELASLRRSYGCVEKVTRKDVHAVQISAGGAGMDGRDSPVVPTSPAISEGRADKFSGGARNTSSAPEKKANTPGGGGGRAVHHPHPMPPEAKGKVARRIPPSGADSA